MENYSMALVEAVYCGVPMLVFDTGGNADIVVNEQNGFIFAEGDTNSMATKAVELLNADQLHALRAKTRARARHSLNFESAATAFVDFIKSL
jgi:glycosyltransferase involved in cell wall biosynthesis